MGPVIPKGIFFAFMEATTDHKKNAYNMFGALLDRYSLDFHIIT